MSTPCICHFLIGIPSSGKSTLAAQLAKLGNYRIVSTDAIRQKLYGDASIQGEWLEVEEQVIFQICEAIASAVGVIYDATNAKRAWRMELLMKLSSKGVGDEVQWMAWHLITPIETCLAWNQQRDRAVPKEVIEKMHNFLQVFPPIPAEGFAAVEKIDVTSPNFDIQQIQTQIQSLYRSIINRVNRTLHPNITLHFYSKLLDFERLMHLISLIIRYPGMGDLQATHPSLVESIFGTVPQFGSSLGEVTAFMEKLCGRIYADKNAIASDLQWLEQNGLIGSGTYASTEEPNKTLSLSSYPSVSSSFPTHRYSDLDTFTRLIQIIRFILHHPLLQNSGQGSLKTLVSVLTENKIIAGDGLDTFRKDNQIVLKPYKILPDFSMRNGYFAGTAILSQQELIRVFGVLQSQAKSLDDPIALNIYETFTDRMARSKQEVGNAYPVRGIVNRCMIDPKFLQGGALSNNLQQLEEEIVNGNLLELNRFLGGGKFAGDEEGYFLAFPLQIVFCDSAWYLGFECYGGKYPELLRFERLDRLFRGNSQGKVRSRQEQEKSLQKLQKLLESSAGIFLGYSASDQRQFLSKDKQERNQVCVTVELWFNDVTFRFITEGTKRFPAKQMKMSMPVGGGKLTLLKSTIFISNDRKSKTGDERFPNHFQVVLPKWSLNDVEFVRWIVGFGGNVKVVQPQELVEKVKGIGKAIVGIYGD